MAKLFISYRRVTWAFTHRLAERLEQLLDAQIFVDFKGVDESNFEHAILRNLRESDAFLLIVTPETFNPERINDEKDWIRREIREALTQEKPIALALYEGTTPPAEELPEDIRDITKRQGIKFYAEYFYPAADDLARFLNKIAPALRLRALPEQVSEETRSRATDPQAPQFERFEIGLQLLKSRYYHDALETFRALRRQFFKPPLQKTSLSALIRKAKEGLETERRRWRAQRTYDQIALLFDIAPEDAWHEWQTFKKTYPELCEDPAELDKKLSTWRYRYIAQLSQYNVSHAWRLWADFKRQYPSYGDPESVEQRLIKWHMPRLAAWSPLSYLRLFIWMLWSPQRLKHYQSLYGQQIAVAYWLASLLTWIPLFLLHLAAVIGTVPTRWRYEPAALLIAPTLALLTVFLSYRVIPQILMKDENIVGMTAGVASVAVLFVTAGVTFSVAAGMTLGVTFGVAVSMAIGMSFSTAAGTTAGIAVGVILGVTGDVAGDVADVVTGDVASIMADNVMGVVAAFAAGSVIAVVTAGVAISMWYAIEKGKPNLISRSMFFLLPLSYAAMIWLLFFGGWRTLDTLFR